jgi:hypothetical protein
MGNCSLTILQTPKPLAIDLESESLNRFPRNRLNIPRSLPGHFHRALASLKAIRSALQSLLEAGHFTVALPAHHDADQLMRKFVRFDWDFPFEGGTFNRVVGKYCRDCREDKGRCDKT